jgi:hypothetical protein
MNEKDSFPIEQFGLYIKGLQLASTQRTASNRHYMLINSALLLLLGTALANLKQSGSFDYLYSMITFLISVVLYTTNFAWYFHLKNNQKQIQAKLEVIKRMEATGDFFPCIGMEKRYLDKLGYKSISGIESLIPAVFCIVAFVAILFSLFLNK